MNKPKIRELEIALNNKTHMFMLEATGSGVSPSILPKIPNLERMIAVARSRKIFMLFVVQSFAMRRRR